MGILDKLFGKTEEQKQVINAGKTFEFVTAYQPVFQSWQGEIYESELVRAAIDARSRHISKLKVEFMGTAKPELSKMLSRRPNPWTTWSKFLYRVNTILDATNNCIIVPIYDEEMNKIGIFPLIANDCKVVEYKKELWLEYTYKTSRKKAACKMSECAILNRFQFRDEFFGSTNKALDPTMNLVSIQKQGIIEAIKNAASYKFMATVSNFIKDEDLLTEQTNFSTRNFGAEAKGGGILLFPNTYKDIKQLDSKAYAVDPEQMKQIKENVFAYFGVNEDILENKAFGDSWSAFYEGAIEPFSIQFSECLTFMIYSDREVAQGSLIMATSNRLQYASFNDKKAWTEGMADRGLATIDELREVWNMPPLPDGMGNRYIARGEYYFIQEEEGDENNAD